MANTSILAAFERMWQHTVAALRNKSDTGHQHDPQDIIGGVPHVTVSMYAPESSNEGKPGDIWIVYE